MKILLVCAGGFSTSILMNKVRKWAASNNEDVRIDAMGKEAYENAWQNYDCILIGPQIRYMEKRIKEKMAVKHIPVGVIPMEDYGRMDGTKVLKYAYSLMNKG